jgi:chromosome segregation ATPase
MHHIDHILDALSQRTQHVFDTAQGAERYQRLSERLQRLYGALELARLLGSAQLARRIETLIDATRRDIDNDG